jgi:hypothetical protein
MVYPLLKSSSASSTSARLPAWLPARLPRSRIGNAQARFAESGRASWRRLAAVALHDPLLLIWQIVTAPFWIGSGVPLPSRPTPRTIQRSIADSISTQAITPGVYLETHLQSLVRRFWVAWIFSSIIRGFTFGTLVGTIWTIGGVLKLVDPPFATGLISLIVIGSILGGGFGATTRPSTIRIAAMLDGTFHLDERLTTAFDPSLTSISPTAMRRLQLADAANAFAEISEDIHGAAVLPIREAVIGVLAGICLLTALLFNIAGSAIPATADAIVPAFVPSSERFARHQQELESQQRVSLTQPVKTSQAADQTANAAKDLSTVGAALETQPVTKPANDDISTGNFGKASQSLRDAASSAANLPQADRNALAKKLDEAAAAISPQNQDLAKASTQAASDLRAGGEQATNGLNDLADQIDATGKKATSQDKQAEGAPPESSASNSSSDQQTSADSPAQQGQPQSDQSQQANQSQQPSSSSSTTNDPGSGMAAQPGIGNEPQKSATDGQQEQTGQPGQPGGAKSGSGEPPQSQPGAGSQQAGQQPGAGAGSTQENGAGKSPASASGTGGSQSQQSEGSGSSGKPGSSSNPSSGSNPSQTAGTGSGAGQASNEDQSKSTTQKNSSSSGTGANKKSTSDSGGVGKAGDPPPGNADTSQSSNDNPSVQTGDQSLVLQGTSDKDSIGTGNDIGSSSSGSGSADGTAAGNATQGQVGPAGPDSNHVPDAYRDVVKGYFNGDGTTP